MKNERCLQGPPWVSNLKTEMLSIPIHDFSVSSLKCRVAFIDCSLCPICFATTHNGVLCWWQCDTMWPWPELELGRLNIRTRENRNEPWRMLLQPPKAHQIAVEWGRGSSDTTIAMSIKCYGSLLTGTQGIKGRTLAIDLLSVRNHTLWKIWNRGQRGWFHVIFCVCTMNSAMLFAILYPVSRYKGIKDV